ncbi:copper amine oxidase N-terminal domain-containing protein [Paenibacillus luteus]|uniref:copper amine oxidase N-terminal domain-containing protein n=1 Tax=Paenibacillus luteus TaxID=2545753 RepID=UPI0011434A6B|nr:copper amine oxidase N-terminal domain-containing protein [Paenibacillus luteus]
MKKSPVLSVFLAMMMLSSLWTAAASAATTTIKTKTQPVQLKFDGQSLKLPDGQYAFIYEGRTYVPIRYISYALQKTVNWDGATATVSEPTEKELEALKKHLQSATSGTQKPQASVEITIQPVKAKLVFDGKAAVLPAGQSLYGYKGSIYAPIRFLSESVGTQIGYDAVTKTVSGESAAYRAEQGGGGVVLPGTGGGTGNAGGGNTGGTGGGTVTLTYEQITAEAESKLAALEKSCTVTLMDVYAKYILAGDADKVKLKEKGIQEVNNCSAKFETIMSETTSKLTSNGFKTDIIATYREAFQKALADGRALAESMA